MEVKWPKAVDFYRTVEQHAATICTGTLLTVDPSSGSANSMPGWALFRGGKLERSSTIKIPLTLTINGRLGDLNRELVKLAADIGPIDVLSIELISKNMSHEYLFYAIGVFMAGLPAKVAIPCPIHCWKAVAKLHPEYEKGDESDAIMFGHTLLARAREHYPTRR
jgi:hypothetical protein